MYKLLREKSAYYENDAIMFTQKLVQTPSESLNESDVADLVEKKMRELDYEKVIRDDFGNVIGTLIGSEPEPTLLLISHMDTIPPIKADIIPGSIDKRRIHGRGASDCKSGLAVQVYTGIVLKNNPLPLKGNLVVAATVAEENGCSIGVKRLIEKTLPMLGIKPSYAVLGDPTNLGLYYGHDGWIELEIKLEGNNPVQVKESAKAIFKELKKSNSGSLQVQDLEILIVKNPCFFNRGEVFDANIVVDRCLQPTEEVPEIIKQIRSDVTLIAESLGITSISVDVNYKTQKLYNKNTTLVQKVTHAWSIDPFNPLIERARYALSTIGCRVHPRKWKLKRLCMGTAGSVLTREFNIPTIGYGPGTEEKAHTDNEYVDIDNIKEALYGTVAIAHSLIGVPVFDIH